MKQNKYPQSERQHAHTEGQAQTNRFSNSQHSANKGIETLQCVSYIYSRRFLSILSIMRDRTDKPGPLTITRNHRKVQLPCTCPVRRHRGGGARKFSTWRPRRSCERIKMNLEDETQISREDRPLLPWRNRDRQFLLVCQSAGKPYWPPRHLIV